MSGKGFKKWWENFVWEVKDFFWAIWLEDIRPFIFTPSKEWILLLKIVVGSFLAVFTIGFIILFFVWFFRWLF